MRAVLVAWDATVGGCEAEGYWLKGVAATRWAFVGTIEAAGVGNASGVYAGLRS
jgi:hypothetical protein